VDLRQRSLPDIRASEAFEGRASFQQELWNWALVVQEIKYSDQGEFRCRLDFQSSPTHTAKILLHVV
ncbi:hypothetical protein SK128_007273, partial [Halocaridina rubra]